MKKERKFPFYSILPLLRRTTLVLSKHTAKYRALNRMSLRSFVDGMFLNSWQLTEVLNNRLTKAGSHTKDKL